MVAGIPEYSVTIYRRYSGIPYLIRQSNGQICQFRIYAGSAVDDYCSCYIFQYQAFINRFWSLGEKNMGEKKYQTGFVLSGGGARGFAHLGFMEALFEEGIHPDIISGTSAGALAGVLIADGLAPREILKLLNTGSRLDFMRPAFPREGLLQISGIVKILNANLHAKKFEDLKIPLFVAATDINNGKAVYFSEGDLIERVTASMSIPVLF